MQIVKKLYFYFRKYFIFFSFKGFAFLLLLLIANSMVFSADDPSKPINVKVGFFSLAGFHEMDENGKKSGYGYDFYNLLTRYANINFEYVGYEKSWDESLDMLRNGEIDLITNANKTKERLKEFDFSNPIGVNTIQLSVLENNNSYVANQFKTYNGIKVGVLKNSICKEKFIRFASDNGFSYEILEFKNSEELDNAIHSGVIDAIASTSLRKMTDEKVLNDFDSEYFYAMVRKDDSDILRIINFSLQQMDDNEGNWESDLKYKNYISERLQQLSFTDKELMFIEAHSIPENEVIIATDTNWAPFSWWDGTKYQGILPEFISKILDDVGICYSFYPANQPISRADVLDSGISDIYIAYIPDSLSAEEEGYVSSPAYLNAGVSYLYRKNNPEFNCIGLLNTCPIMNSMMNLGKEKSVIYYEDTAAAVVALKQGEVDAVLLYTYDAVRTENQDKTGLLTYKMIPGLSLPILTVSKKDRDHILVSIISKCVNHFPEVEKDSIISKYISYSAIEYTIADFIVMHPVGFIVTVVLLFFIALTLVFYIIKKNAKIRIEEEKNKQQEIYSLKISEALRAAEHANNAKTVFLNNMSHDIRTPMNAIIGFTSLARTHIEEKLLVDDYLKKIATSSNHLLSLINDVLDMSRIESGKVKIISSEVELSEIIDDINTIINTSADSKKLNMKVSVHNIVNNVIIADKLRVNQVLLNILSNAIKFTPEGGSVSVDVTQKTDAPEGFADYIFCIKDTGIGMSEEFKKHIFEAFSREETSTVSGILGTGLGMAITKNIVDMMNGSISVNSKQGKGSEFIVELRFPIGTGCDISSEKEKKYVVSTVDFNGKKILLVEDNELNQEIACTILREEGFIVDVACDGTEAVGLVGAEKGLEYDIILMDIQMPKMDGYEATSRIRAMGGKRKNIPIIAMTANAFDEDKSKAFSCGMNGHIGKPIVIQDLLDTLASFLVQ